MFFTPISGLLRAEALTRGGGSNWPTSRDRDPRSRATLDATVIVEAASHAIRLWPDYVGI
jgi:hypothetical protein